MKAILLGNGINSKIKIDGMSQIDIQNRFFDNLIRYAPIIENLFSVRISPDTVCHLYDKTTTENIEILAGKLYKYIKEKKAPWWENDELHLQDTITCICILSIFYDDKGKIRPTYEKGCLPEFSDYDKIFTLNYFEFWDDSNICIPLHGYVDYNQLKDCENAFIYSVSRYYLPEYQLAVNQMSKNGNGVAFDPFDIVLAPDGVSKRMLICIHGLFPSDYLLPDEDIFPIEPKQLYKEFDDVTELDILGVSPYGDRDLIECINSIKYVRVFVHNRATSETTAIWDNILKCSHEILDSEQI